MTARARAEAARPEDSSVQALKAAAVARVYARRRPPEYRTAVGAGPYGADLKVLVNGHLSEFLPSLTLAEWCDDQIARLPLAEPYGTAIRILDAVRTGRDAPSAAVRAARELGPWNQWVLWNYLSAPLPPQLPSGAELALQPVQAKWRGEGLVTERAQAERQVIPVRILNRDDLSDAQRPRAAIPAGRAG